MIIKSIRTKNAQKMKKFDDFDTFGYMAFA